MFPNDPGPENFESAAEPIETNQNPADHQHDHPKRNSGRTGPTSTTGRATSSRNATRHGMCATTLILNYENEADWLLLLNTWLAEYHNPADTTLLYTFVLKAAQAEWFRLRLQHQYDLNFLHHGAPPINAWTPAEIKQHDLVQRYLTAAERKFQRDYRMLEQHWKSHHKPSSESKKAATQPDPEPADEPMPQILYVNNLTGEALDAFGNRFPPPPDWKPKKIIPGVYEPDHPAYEGP